MISISVSVTLSSTQKLDVPEDFDITDENALKQTVIDQIMLPQDALMYLEDYSWTTDDFSVIYEE